MLASSIEIGYNIPYNNIDNQSNTFNISQNENGISQYLQLPFLREIASAKLSKSYEWRELRSNFIFILNSVNELNTHFYKSIYFNLHTLHLDSK